MSKGKKQKRLKGAVATSVRSGGFELGDRSRVMYFSESDHSFNESMSAANVLGCAYGYDAIDGFPGPVPAITIICTDGEKLKAAFDCFKHWGSEADGDVVGITILLKRDGSYLLAVGPDFERFTHRMSGGSDVYEGIFAGLTWLKTMDSTNSMLLEIKGYAASKFAPIVISGATVPPNTIVPRPDMIRYIDEIDRLVKFRTQIISEAEAEVEGHWVLNFVRPDQKIAKGRDLTSSGPKQIANSRHRLISTVFPVSRERIRRNNILEKVRMRAEMVGVTDDQIFQAAINIVISFEIAGGKPHFEGIDDVKSAAWDHIQDRVERADGNDIYASTDIDLLCDQIKRDVWGTIIANGSPIENSFRKSQKLFLRLGYGG